MNTALFSPKTPALTMTSREIAELVNLRHDNVKRTIETLINQKVIESPQIEEIPTATKKAVVYRFSGHQGKRDSIVVVARLSPEFTARLVDRWQELEAGQQQTAPQVHNLQTAALIHALQQLDAVQHSQQQQAQKIDRLEENLAIVEARTQPENCHFTVMGYARLHGQKIDLTQAAKWGKKCANLSRERGLPIGEVRDPRFGRVFTYHDSVLAQVLPCR